MVERDDFGSYEGRGYSGRLWFCEAGNLRALVLAVAFHSVYTLITASLELRAE